MDRFKRERTAANHPNLSRPFFRFVNPGASRRFVLNMERHAAGTKDLMTSIALL
jgi:hypothetical protein